MKINGLFSYLLGVIFHMLDYNLQNGITLTELTQHTMQNHRHNFLEFVYIFSGSIKHFIQNEEQIVREGDCFIIDYELQHRYIKIPETPCDLVNVLFRPEHIDRSLYQCRRLNEVAQNYLIHLNYKPFTPYFHDETGEIRALVEKMRTENKEQNAAKREMMRCLLLETLILFLRKTSDVANSANHAVTEQLLRIAETRFAEPLTLTELCKQLNYSIPYISTLFKKEMGVGFETFLQKIRMDNAARLLANTKKSVGEIAMESGYTDLKFFHNLFRRHFSMSPIQYRRTAERNSLCTEVSSLNIKI